jgi:hypothetical protein
MTEARKDGPSAAARIRVMKRDRFTCTYCGVPGTEAELEVDHIVAVANGGSHHISNLTTACRACNQDKGAKELRPSFGPGRSKPAAESRHPLVGMFFHTFLEDGRIQYQAQVLAVDGETVLAQMFSALDGCPTDVLPFEKSFIYSSRCRMYADHEVWCNKYAEACKRDAPFYRRQFDEQMKRFEQKRGAESEFGD